MPNKFFKKIFKYRTLLFMLTPAILYFIVFNYLPMFGIVIAFKKFNYSDGIFGSPWAGFDNFKFLFLNDTLFKVSRNTVLYNLAFIIINNSFAIAIAIMFTEIRNKLYKRVTQSLTFMPYFISWVVVGTFVYNIFNYEYGFLNSTLRSLGMNNYDVFNKPFAWVFIIIFFSLWKNAGYLSVIYIASIISISNEIYEAADIDGASKFQKVFKITIPSIVPTIIIMILLSLGQVFRGDFSMFFQIVGNNALVFSTTDVIDTFVTRSLLRTREFGMSAAAGLIQSVFCFIFINIANAIIKKYQKDYALF